MLPGFGGFAPFFAYDLDADTTTDADAGTGAITYQMITQTVPEPGTAGLVAVALLGIAGLRRTR